MNTTTYVHGVTNVTVKPVEDLRLGGTMSRTIVIKGEGDDIIEITMFGKDAANLGITEEYAP